MGKQPKSKTTATAASTTRRVEGRKEEDENNDEEETTSKIGTVLPFPESDCYSKAKSCFSKGNRYKSNKLLLQGSKKGCTHCLGMYAESHLYSVDDLVANSHDHGHLDLINRKDLHIAFPLFLEGAIRGDVDSIHHIDDIIYSVEGESLSKKYIKTNMYAMNLYWQKYYEKQGFGSNFGKISGKKIKTMYGIVCHGCYKQESDTVTLKKCGACNFYFYCNAECQKKMWQDGGHAGECRQLAILKQYHRPHGKYIRDRLVNGVDPKDIPELQELRRRLGLDRPKAEYDKLLEQVKSGCIGSRELIVPNKDGTVQIGSFPHPM